MQFILPRHDRTLLATTSALIGAATLLLAWPAHAAFDPNEGANASFTANSSGNHLPDTRVLSGETPTRPLYAPGSAPTAAAAPSYISPLEPIKMPRPLYPLRAATSPQPQPVAAPIEFRAAAAPAAPATPPAPAARSTAPMMVATPAASTQPTVIAPAPVLAAAPTLAPMPQAKATPSAVAAPAVPAVVPAVPAVASRVTAPVIVAAPAMPKLPPVDPATAARAQAILQAEQKPSIQPAPAAPVLAKAPAVAAPAKAEAPIMLAAAPQAVSPSALPGTFIAPAPVLAATPTAAPAVATAPVVVVPPIVTPVKPAVAKPVMVSMPVRSPVPAMVPAKTMAAPTPVATAVAPAPMPPAALPVVARAPTVAPTPIPVPAPMAMAAKQPVDDISPIVQPDLSSQSREVLSHVPSGLDSPKATKTTKVQLDRVSPEIKQALGKSPEEENYESAGISIKVRRPGLDTNYELNSAYNSLMGGDTQRAISIYKNILSTEPRNEDALFGLAATYHRLGMETQARPYYASLLKINPNHREALNNFLVLVSGESPADALPELERLALRNPDFSPIPAQIAILYDKLGYPDQARESMLRAIDLAPENLTYKYNLAIMLDRQKHYADAVALYRVLIQAALNGEQVPASVESMERRLNYITTAATEGTLGT